jgi:hypothetical protein
MVVSFAGRLLNYINPQWESKPKKVLQNKNKGIVQKCYWIAATLERLSVCIPSHT